MIRIALHAPRNRTITDRLLDRRTPRELGHIVRDLQRAQVRNLNANATQCIGCALAAQFMHSQAIMALPRRYRRDDAWRHAHVVMPGARIYARMLDKDEEYGR